jgi:S1-C subfamily serine protease
VHINSVLYLYPIYVSKGSQAEEKGIAKGMMVLKVSDKVTKTSKEIVAALAYGREGPLS